MKTLFFAVLFFFIGLIGLLGLRYYRLKQALSVTPIPIPQPEVTVTPEPTLALMPPSEALSGTLTVLSGHVEKFSRGEKEYQEASTGAQILLGESIATKIKSRASASINGMVTATLEELSELIFGNLFPDNLVLQQRSGKIRYQILKPISVRALHTLISLQPGDVTVTIIDTDMSITVKNGSVRFALVDADNNTKLYDLKAGERANIDDAARKVTLVQPR